MPETGTILVANIGSTSFKFRLFEMPSERVLARGGIERIGASESPWSLRTGEGPPSGGTGTFSGYGEAVAFVQQKLVEAGILENFESLTAFGFKPVMARDISGTQILDETVLEAMQQFSAVFPAHNPPYIRAVREFREMYPGIPCIGTFETAFYDQVPERNRRFGIPLQWEREYGVRRYGFHGASHKFIATRFSEIKKREDLRIISCHLGGSSSIACIQNGVALDSSWGMTAQSGLPHNNRVGDFDVFALFFVMEQFGLSAKEAAEELSKNGGLKGMSGLESGDYRDLKEAAEAGNKDARTALESFVGSIRKFIGQYLMELNGADALIFTGGIGENNSDLREAVCRDLDFCGIHLDSERNHATRSEEKSIGSKDAKIEVWVLPTNEELVIARNAWNKLADT